jgi:hypothetical protein
LEKVTRAGEAEAEMSDQPKPAMTINGEPWWHFHYEYDFEGKTYGFDVVARSADEADRRMKKIALARYLGQGHGGPISVWRGGFLAPLICWWKNLPIAR